MKPQLSQMQGVRQVGGDDNDDNDDNEDDEEMPLVADSEKRHKGQFDFWLGVHDDPLTQ